jgi:hypothetical protein
MPSRSFTMIEGRLGWSPSRRARRRVRVRIGKGPRGPRRPSGNGSRPRNLAEVEGRRMPPVVLRFQTEGRRAKKARRREGQDGGGLDQDGERRDGQARWKDQRRTFPWRRGASGLKVTDRAAARTGSCGPPAAQASRFRYLMRVISAPGDSWTSLSASTAFTHSGRRPPWHRPRPVELRRARTWIRYTVRRPHRERGDERISRGDAIHAR